MRDRGVGVQYLDVFDRHTEPISHDHRPRCLVTLAVRGGPGDHLDLAGGQHAHLRVLPSTGSKGELREQTTWREPAHLHVRRDADPEMAGAALGALGCLLATPFVVAD